MTLPGDRTIRSRSARRPGIPMSMREQSQSHQNHTTMDRDRYRRWRSSMVEQLICNQQVAGSSPIASSADEENDHRMIAWTKPSSARRSPSREGLGTLSGFPSRRPDGFPSGQREQTVNLSSLTSKVRILPRPRRNSGNSKQQNERAANEIDEQGERNTRE